MCFTTQLITDTPRRSAPRHSAPKKEHIFLTSVIGFQFSTVMQLRILQQSHLLDEDHIFIFHSMVKITTLHVYKFFLQQGLQV